MFSRRSVHPYIVILYFTSLLCWIVLYQHPISSFVFFVSLLLVSLCLKKLNKQTLIHGSILIILITISNPIFVREGIDILYQNDYITITKQALVYGVFVSFIIVCVLLLYQIMQVYLTSEHILYIFNKHFAVLGLLLMIVFRMLPKCKRKIKEIQDVQNTLHHKGKGLWYMLRSLKDQFLVLFTWIFESSLILYESMKARGYQNKRTHFHVFYWQMTDTFYVGVILLLNIGVYMGYLRYQNFYYYPKMATITLQGIDILIYLLLFVYCLLPLCWKGDQHDYY